MRRLSLIDTIKQSFLKSAYKKQQLLENCPNVTAYGTSHLQVTATTLTCTPMGHGTVVVPYTDVCPNKLSLEESFRKRMETQWAQEDEMEKDGNTKIFTYSRDKSGKVKKELAIEDC